MCVCVPGVCVFFSLCGRILATQQEKNATAARHGGFFFINSPSVPCSLSLLGHRFSRGAPLWRCLFASGPRSGAEVASRVDKVLQGNMGKFCPMRTQDVSTLNLQKCQNVSDLQHISTVDIQRWPMKTPAVISQAQI